MSITNPNNKGKKKGSSNSSNKNHSSKFIPKAGTGKAAAKIKPHKAGGSRGS